MSAVAGFRRFMDYPVGEIGAAQRKIDDDVRVVSGILGRGVEKAERESRKLVATLERSSDITESARRRIEESKIEHRDALGLVSEIEDKERELKTKMKMSEDNEQRLERELREAREMPIENPDKQYKETTGLNLLGLVLKRLV